MRSEKTRVDKAAQESNPGFLKVDCLAIEPLQIYVIVIAVHDKDD